MARKTYELSVVTPERKVVEDQVNSTTLPAENGYLGVWANHAPLVAAIVPGTLTVHEGTSEIPTARYCVGAGFAEVSDGKMILVVDCCELDTEIDLQSAEAHLEHAKAELRKWLDGDKDVDLDAANAEKELAEARLRVAFLREN